MAMLRMIEVCPVFTPVLVDGGVSGVDGEGDDNQHDNDEEDGSDGCGDNDNDEEDSSDDGCVHL